MWLWPLEQEQTDPPRMSVLSLFTNNTPRGTGPPQQASCLEYCCATPAPPWPDSLSCSFCVSQAFNRLQVGTPNPLLSVLLPVLFPGCQLWSAQHSPWLMQGVWKTSYGPHGTEHVWVRLRSPPLLPPPGCPVAGSRLEGVKVCRDALLLSLHRTCICYRLPSAINIPLKPLLVTQITGDPNVPSGINTARFPTEWQCVFNNLCTEATMAWTSADLDTMAVQASTHLSSHPKALLWAHMTARSWRRDRMESLCPSTELSVRSVAGRSSHAPPHRSAAVDCHHGCIYAL